MKYFLECFMNFLAFLLKGVNIAFKFFVKVLTFLIEMNQKFIDKYGYKLLK